MDATTDHRGPVVETRLRDGAPMPHGKQIQTPINSAFGATTGRAAKKMGGVGYARGISHEETMS
eukprot:scaffold81186_cov78-Phaeocystis_antarctica.AAC.1